MTRKFAIIVSRTRWSEPPRLRHQVAKLLASNGYYVVFLEKSSISKLFLMFHLHEKSNCINCLPLIELVHHQLCIFPVFSCFSNIFTLFQLLYIRTLSIDAPLIINFNYDFWFLRILFRKSRIVTILNDDFVLASKIKLFNHAYRRLIKTCSISTKVLAVSPQILDYLPCNSSFKLFTPWCPPLNSPFPALGVQERNRFVYWGYINDRLDFDSITYFLNNHKSLHLTFIGPVESSFKNRFEKLLKYPNFTWVSSCELSDINTHDLLGFFIPYDVSHPISLTLYLPNKFLQLLSLGFPLLIPDLTKLKSHESLLRYDPTDQESMSNLIVSIDVDLISRLRPSISEFLSIHSEVSAIQDIVGE